MSEFEGSLTRPVSVIIPSYNHADFLPSAVGSLQAQTLEEWEAIIVDDGSTDGTYEICARFDDPRLRYVYQSNQGLSAARNKGLSLASGETLAFLDADDEWEPEFLKTTSLLLDSDRSLAGVYTRTYFIDQAGSRLARLGGHIVPPEGFRRRIQEGGFFPPSAVLLRATAIRTVGLFDTNLTSLEDWDFWLRLSRIATLKGIDRPLARYRISPGSMSTDSERMHANRLSVLTKHYGKDDADLEKWPSVKRRAYGFAYRDSALGFLQQANTDQAWSLLEEAVNYWPRLLKRLDTFYEFACGDQPLGHRGDVSSLNINANGLDLLRHLESLFATANPSVGSMRKHAYGSAFLALAMLSDQAGRWDDARSYLWRAVRADPQMLSSHDLLRRAGKLIAGTRVTRTVRRLRTAGPLSGPPHDSPSPEF